jgi:hypothetical protein
MTEQTYTSQASEDFARVLLILHDAIKLAGEHKLEEATKRIAAAYGAGRLAIDIDQLRTAEVDLAEQQEAIQHGTAVLKSLTAGDDSAQALVQGFYDSHRLAELPAVK